MAAGMVSSVTPVSHKFTFFVIGIGFNPEEFEAKHYSERNIHQIFPEGFKKLQFPQ